MQRIAVRPSPFALCLRTKLSRIHYYNNIINHQIFYLMKYKIVEKKNPQKPDVPGKYYANAVNTGKFTIKNFAKEIAGRSSLTKGDIENVLENFLDELPTFLKLGLSVQLGAFGTLRLSLASEGADSPQAFKSDLIKGAKVIFTPGVDLKDALKDITYEEDK
jgi:predicted histone-like DNA-binding protein